MSRAGRSRNWVSKTDLIRYIRCPYAFCLLDQGIITFEDTIDEFQVRLLTEGAEFERAVEGSAIRVAVGPEEVPALLREDITLFNVPTFENPKLKIYGQPDGVEAAGGALIPIEIKSHTDVQRTDELELAFYWLLLEPYRTKKNKDPRGVLFLRRNGGVERVEVSIRLHRFDEVHRLLQEARDARRRAVRERICGCNVCSLVKREDVLRATRERKDLTLIFNIGRHYAGALEAMQIRTYEDLPTCLPETVVAGLRERGYFVSVEEIRRWQRHAQAWMTGKPVSFGNGTVLRKSFIALDLEYTQGLMWLVGVCIVKGDERKYFALWADDARQERHNLRALTDLIQANPSLPVVTWAGRTADIPNLLKASKRARLNGAMDGLCSAHLDLFEYTRENLRLPIPTFELKRVAEFFGIPRISSVRDGLQAEWMYNEFRRTRGERRKEFLRAQLLEYNRDDLDALIGTAEQIRKLMPPRGRRCS